ncbi:HK97 family phage prohead protease [Cutibacterium avidum]|uniref:HK97 family phage prohead protease n=1 Tax=Cutibacterium avidum TaxID=33010 RepID=UPI002FF31D33
MSDIETRAVILDTRTDTQPDDIRTFTGRVVPWNTPTTLFPGLREQFAPGSVRIDPDQPPMLFRDHRTPIGRITALDDHDDGLHVTGHISATATGDDTLTLIRDGVLDRMSIGFEPVAADETRNADGTLITRTDTIIREASIVPFPAYPTAQITEHRHQEEIMGEPTPDTLTRADLDDLATRADLEELATRADLNELSRRVETIHASPAQERRDTRSAGQIIKDIIGGDTATIDAANRWQDRAYAGAGLDDIPATIPAGIESLVQVIDTANPVAGLFKTAGLPATGMQVNFLKIKDKSIKVGKQAKPGDDLPGPSKVAFETASAPIEVFGGWTELDLVTVQRMEVPELDTMLKAMAVEIGKARADRLLTALKGAVDERKATDKVTISAVDSADSWSDAIVDAQIKFLDTGVPLDGLLVSPDVFKALRKLKDSSGHWLMGTFGTNDNVQGVIDGLSGQLGPIRVTLWNKADDNTMTFWARDAVSIRTNGVVQLQDTNVINLTGQWSLHQLSATCVERPDLLLPVVVGAGA